MASLLQRATAPAADGLIQSITPESAHWRYVGFEAYSLKPGQTVSRRTGDREVCIVLVTGKADVSAGGHSWPTIGERMSVFEDKRPYAVYVPAGDTYAVTAMTDLEIGVCSAPGRDGRPARLIPPEAVAYHTRGAGTNLRHIYDILPDTAPADSLLVVEVVTPPGHWSSYPPHKHDTDAMPEESYLEETYYHRIDPPHGFAVQRVYTDDGLLDETMAVHDHDVVMVPRGYHPVGAPHGYSLYYLNTMAGPKRAWRFRTAPSHEWLAT